MLRFLSGGNTILPRLRLQFTSGPSEGLVEPKPFRPRRLRYGIHDPTAPDPVPVPSEMLQPTEDDDVARRVNAHAISGEGVDDVLYAVPSLVAARRERLYGGVQITGGNSETLDDVHVSHRLSRNEVDYVPAVAHSIGQNAYNNCECRKRAKPCRPCRRFVQSEETRAHAAYRHRMTERPGHELHEVVVPTPAEHAQHVREQERLHRIDDLVTTGLTLAVLLPVAAVVQGVSFVGSWFSRRD